MLEAIVYFLLTLFFILYSTANLDNGKVIHLVIRPIDAPHNPLNGMKYIYTYKRERAVETKMDFILIQ